MEGCLHGMDGGGVYMTWMVFMDGDSVYVDSGMASNHGINQSGKPQ
jgi:hypothetical protein